jgi:hypothetical protein
MKETTKTRLKIIAIGVAIVSTIGFMLYTADSMKRNNEIRARTSVAANVYLAIIAYMNLHEGQWPTSWEHIAQVNDDPEWERHPIDIAFYKTWVEVDFKFDPRQCLDTPYPAFQAIKPKGEVFDKALEEHSYPMLLETVSRYYEGVEEQSSKSADPNE